MGIQDLNGEFQEGLRGLQEREMVLIPGGVYVGKIMSLRILLRRGSMTEVLNRYLDAAVIESKNRWRKRE